MVVGYLLGEAFYPDSGAVSLKVIKKMPLSVYPTLEDRESAIFDSFWWIHLSPLLIGQYPRNSTSNQPECLYKCTKKKGWPIGRNGNRFTQHCGLCSGLQMSTRNNNVFRWANLRSRQSIYHRSISFSKCHSDFSLPCSGHGLYQRP